MIAVIDYGIGNLRSAQKALLKVGGDAELVSSLDEAKEVTGVVLPGVGAFGSCMRALKESRLDELVYDSISREIPFLGICVGMQMLFDGSEENPLSEGLKVLKGRSVKIEGDVKLPHMQWSQLNILDRSTLFNDLEQSSYMYFIHSYAIKFDETEGIDQISLATTNYGMLITAAVRKNNIFGVQFHPEKSGVKGLKLLENFVNMTR